MAYFIPLITAILHDSPCGGKFNHLNTYPTINTTSFSNEVIRNSLESNASLPDVTLPQPAVLISGIEKASMMQYPRTEDINYGLISTAGESLGISDWQASTPQFHLHAYDVEPYRWLDNSIYFENTMISNSWYI